MLLDRSWCYIFPSCQ